MGRVARARRSAAVAAATVEAEMQRTWFRDGEAVEFVSDGDFADLPCNSKGRVADGPWWRNATYRGTAREFGRSYHRVTTDGGRSHYIPARRLRPIEK